MSGLKGSEWALWQAEAIGQGWPSDVAAKLAFVRYVSRRDGETAERIICGLANQPQYALWEALWLARDYWEQFVDLTWEREDTR